MIEGTVVVAGAGIAGPALAFWLHRFGAHVVVVERAPALRPGGQTVDLRGAGRVVAQRMGIEDAVRAASTGEKGVAFIDEAGRARARIGVKEFDVEGPVVELEVLRGDLSALLHERTHNDVEYVFGDHITALDDAGDQVGVELAGGRRLEADIVVGADGIYSGTRRLMFGDENGLRPLGYYSSYFSIPRG